MIIGVFNHHQQMLESRNRFASHDFGNSDWEIVLSCAFQLKVFECDAIRKVNHLIQSLINHEESPSPTTFETGLMAYEGVLEMTRGRYSSEQES